MVSKIDVKIAICACAVALGVKLGASKFIEEMLVMKVGDSLLTLPEQLEPYFTQDNPSLISALKEGKIPYQKDDSVGAQYDHHWLECFVHGSTEIFGQNILKIKRLTTYSTRQLLADLDYYFNILAALEINPSNELSAIKKLLEVEPQTFRAKVEELSSLPGVTKSISHMRGITL